MPLKHSTFLHGPIELWILNVQTLMVLENSLDDSYRKGLDVCIVHVLGSRSGKL